MIVHTNRGIAIDGLTDMWRDVQRAMVPVTKAFDHTFDVFAYAFASSGVVLARSIRNGRRRHGAVKHARDHKRYIQKRMARR